MKSRINIDLDEDNQPVIEVVWRESEDVRDKMVKKFLDTFGTNSTLALFAFTEGPSDGRAVAKIRPIIPDDYERIVDGNQIS